MVNSHFHNIDSSNPQAWNLSPSGYIIFDFFHQCIIVFCYSFFVSLGKFIPRYFVVVVVVIAMINIIDSLISLPDFSLLLYRNVSHFLHCVSILHLVTLLNSLINSSNFLSVYLGLSMYSIMLSTVRVLLLLQCGLFLFIFSSFIAITRTSKTMMNNSGKRGQLCLIHDVRGNVFRFSLLRIRFSVLFLVCDLYYVEVQSFHAHFCEKLSFFFS